jgi:hypothetical protein
MRTYEQQQKLLYATWKYDVKLPVFATLCTHLALIRIIGDADPVERAHGKRLVLSSHFSARPRVDWRMLQLQAGTKVAFSV